MKSLTRKLFISVAVLAVAITAMSTSTFAWFTMSGTASIDTVTTSVDGGSGFLISSDGVSFGDKLTLSDVYTGDQAAANTTYGSAPSDGTDDFDPTDISATAPIFKTLTSVPGSEGKAFQDLAGNPDTNSNVDYLDFTIWFTASAATPIYLHTATVTSATETFKPLASFTHKTVDYAASSTIDVNAENAVRLSMVSSEATPTTQIINGPQIAATGATDLGGTFNDVDNTVTDFASVAYYNAVMDTDLDSYTAPTTDYTYVTGKPAIINLAASNASAQYVTFRLWLEGWDGDAFDAIRGQSITLDLTFTSDIDNAQVL